MVAEGALATDAPEAGPGSTGTQTVDGIIGQHVYPQLDAGTVGSVGRTWPPPMNCRSASSDGWTAALPQRTVDPVVAAAHVITALQTVVSRSCTPQPAVLTFGKISGGHARNVIPDEIVLDGTLRTDEPTAKTLRAAIHRVAVRRQPSVPGRGRSAIGYRP